MDSNNPPDDNFFSFFLSIKLEFVKPSVIYRVRTDSRLVQGGVQLYEILESDQRTIRFQELTF